MDIEDNNYNDNKQKILTPDGAAEIWTKPSNHYIEFAIVEGREKDLGFVRGECAPTGNVIWLWFPNDAIAQMLQVNPIQWKNDYKTAVKYKIIALLLRRKQQETKDKGEPE